MRVFLAFFFSITTLIPSAQAPPAGVTDSLLTPTSYYSPWYELTRLGYVLDFQFIKEDSMYYFHLHFEMHLTSQFHGGTNPMKIDVRESEPLILSLYNKQQVVLYNPMFISSRDNPYAGVKIKYPISRSDLELLKKSSVKRMKTKYDRPYYPESTLNYRVLLTEKSNLKKEATYVLSL